MSSNTIPEADTNADVREDKHPKVIMALLLMVVLVSCVSSMPAELAINEVSPGKEANTTNWQSSPGSLAQYIRRKITVIQTSDILPENQIETGIIYAAEFLTKEFGVPVITHPISIVVQSSSADNHARTSVRGQERTIYVDPINFFKTEWPYLVHELFHALYQDQVFVSLSVGVVEGWAHYAELRSRYEGIPNADIMENLLAQKNMKMVKCRKVFPAPEEWQQALANGINTAYFESACPLLYRSHSENRHALEQYQKWTIRNGMVSNYPDFCHFHPTRSRDGYEINLHMRAVQTCLKAIGYYDGIIDGVFGPKTKAGIDRVASRYGISPTVNLPTIWLVKRQIVFFFVGVI